MWRAIAHPKRSAQPHEEFLGGANAGKGLVVGVDWDLPEARFKVQFGPVAVLANLGEDILDVRNREGIAAGLGVKGTVVYDKPELS